MGKNLENYDSLLVLTHFKGHSKGGFGGSNKNIGIGCAGGQTGKKAIHTTPRLGRYVGHLERGVHGADDRIGQSGGRPLRRKDRLYQRQCATCRSPATAKGTAAEPVVTPNVGILASTDILAVDAASVDLVYAMKEEEHHALVERMESRHGLRQITYMKELGMGNDRYTLLDIDHGDAPISLEEAVEGLEPFKGLRQASIAIKRQTTCHF